MSDKPRSRFSTNKMRKMLRFATDSRQDEKSTMAQIQKKEYYRFWETCDGTLNRRAPFFIPIELESANMQQLISWKEIALCRAEINFSLLKSADKNLHPTWFNNIIE